MGKLHYGYGSEAIVVPDELLAHVQALVTTKLRRSESFTLSWKQASDPTVGRSTIWLHCSIPLRFEFDTADAITLDRGYLSELAESAARGGVLIDLDAQDAPISAIARKTLEKAA
ncbi:hypothetical protein [Microbacterium sp. SLBN-146]|uniref:DUF7882 family protein n=1 Tax=Microbacterium sp. SLBN-146 TaxID=2768457 RepID=UPI0011504F22|nr:hypothetical protein [Microbacterium sp. SLBN-146]TQJ30104.1 hypothetical protein FBY39_0549 [Microbacterium sp. SLBN-146]